MNIRTRFLIPVLLLLTGHGAYPQATKVDTVSEREVLPVVVVQRDSPLKIVAFLIVRDSDGRIATQYSVRNIGSKAIKAYKIATWFDDDTGFLGGGEMPKKGALLAPEQEVTTISDKIINRQSRTPSDSVKKMKKIAFIMITEIEFADGSQYSETETFDALEEFLRVKDMD